MRIASAVAVPRLEGHGMLDHLVVLLGNQVPANRAAEHAGQVGEGACHARLGQVEALVLDALEAGHQAHPAQQVAEGKGDLGLAVRIHEVLLDPHLRIMADQALDHGRDLGEREVPQLRVDADGIGLDVPVDEHPIALVARAPLRHQVLPPTLKALAIGGTGVAFAPQPGITQGEDLVDDRRIGVAQGLHGEVVLPNIEQFVIASSADWRWRRA